MKKTKISINLNGFPDEITSFIKNSDIYDSSCSENARVFYIDKDNGYFLKKSSINILESEYLMHSYFHTLGLTSPVVSYIKAENNEYLLTEKVNGADCLDEAYLKNPDKLCDVIAECLYFLHSRSYVKCPIKNRTNSYIKAVSEGYSKGKYESDLFEGLWEFTSFTDAWNAAKEGINNLETNVLIHGDYCLPNIILNNWKLSGFIDLGSAGVSDRHIDILWGIWTLKYNLGTFRYTDRFIDCYGRELIDMDKLRCIAAMEMIGEG